MTAKNLAPNEASVNFAGMYYFLKRFASFTKFHDDVIECDLHDLTEGTLGTVCILCR